MTQRVRIYLTFALLLMGGLMFAVLPGNWIELRLGLSADAGSGLLEFFLPAIPIAFGLGLACGLRVRRAEGVQSPRPLLSRLL